MQKSGCDMFNLLKFLKGDVLGEEVRDSLSFSMQPILEDKFQDLRIILAQPEVMPCYFDNTIEFWLKRIGLWGKLDIKHTDTNPNINRWITVGELEKLLTTDTTLNTFGNWNAEKLTYKSIVLKRDYIGPNGQKHKERLTIDIELKPEIKKGMKFSESMEDSNADVRKVVENLK